MENNQDGKWDQSIPSSTRWALGWAYLQGSSGSCWLLFNSRRACLLNFFITIIQITPFDKSRRVIIFYRHWLPFLQQLQQLHWHYQHRQQYLHRLFFSPSTLSPQAPAPVPAQNFQQSEVPHCRTPSQPFPEAAHRPPPRPESDPENPYKVFQDPHYGVRCRRVALRFGPDSLQYFRKP